ncbi:MmcQ/YjbR family DNA-binding protein [Phocea massiliensis]|uniref:MmcQ/YjbR family DNA-binding protein n=1 Tax=Merdimmobilis hominis TaxID=2897707 RepID=A0A938X6P8_9FIRM|nr:MmcQ/YjbR family DNA-binding protein [Merdimmobilis hominis]
MRYLWIDEFLLNKRSVMKDLQPSWNWIRYQIGGKMFAAICLDSENNPYYITLKVDPAESEFLRSQYTDIIPGYYSDKRNWISVNPDGCVPDALLKELLDKAYRLVLSGFSKKRQREILNISCCGAECTSCALYETACEGCNACQGKVFHMEAGKSCPIYVCAIIKHRYRSCGDCESFPCDLVYATRDPALSDAEFAASVDERVRRLREV